MDSTGFVGFCLRPDTVEFAVLTYEKFYFTLAILTQRQWSGWILCGPRVNRSRKRCIKKSGKLSFLCLHS